MSKLVLLTGGARSGKSSYAEELIKKEGDNILYVATAIAFDSGMKDRIKKHRAQRPSDWETLERYRDFKDLEEKQYDAVLLDCMTIMVSNLMLDEKVDYDTCSHETIDKIEYRIKLQVEDLLKYFGNQNLYIVTNEIGMGVVPPYRMGNIFRDIAGRINQSIAARADDVYLLVSGIPVKIK